MAELDFNNVVTIWDPYMTDLEPLEYVKQYYKEVFSLDTTGLTLDSKLVDTGIDSLESFNLLYEIENTYQIRFNQKFAPITIGDVVTEIENLRKAKET